MILRLVVSIATARLWASATSFTQSTKFSSSSSDTSIGVRLDRSVKMVGTLAAKQGRYEKTPTGYEEKTDWSVLDVSQNPWNAIYHRPYVSLRHGLR
jgi:hypothetical protein